MDELSPEISFADFADTLGSTYAVHAGDGQVELVLEKAVELTPSVRPGGSFRLEFRGPADPMLEQATYLLHREDRTFEIFIVPIAQDERGTSYEAIFN